MTSVPAKTLQVLVATPLGLHGRGGIDRLNDMVFSAIEAQHRTDIRIDRLVIRGQGGLFSAQFVFAYALVRLVLAAARGDVDLLHIHLSDRGSCYRKSMLGAVARRLGIPYVVHLHGAIFLEYWSVTAPAWVRRAVNRLFEGSVGIITLGQYWARAISDRLPDVADKIVVLPNATPAKSPNRSSTKSDVVRISCLGQLGQRKGTPQLIEALHGLAGRQDWVATIAGDGTIEESRAQVRTLGLDGRVSIPGWLGSDAIDDLLDNTDILVLPSFFENLPMVILEAFAHGVPVVSTPVGAIPEVVKPGHNGLLVPAGDVRALGDALEQLIDNPAQRLAFGQAARSDHAQNHETGRYVVRLVDFWQRSAGNSMVVTSTESAPTRAS